MHETHSIIPLSFTFFAAFSLTSAIVLDTPIQLLSTSDGSNNTTITNNYNNNALPFSLPSNHPTSNSSRPFSPPPPTSAVFLSYVCNGDAFGYDLDVPSCNNAIRFVGFNTTERSFGMRDSREFDILLPQRFISSNGKCVIEPALAPGVTEARASPEDIAVASVAVVRNCAAKTPSRGGIAKEIGASFVIFLRLPFFSLFLSLSLSLSLSHAQPTFPTMITPLHNKNSGNNGRRCQIPY